MSLRRAPTYADRLVDIERTAADIFTLAQRLRLTDGLPCCGAALHTASFDALDTEAARLRAEIVLARTTPRSKPI